MRTAWLRAASVRLLQVRGAGVYGKVYNDIKCLVLLHVSRSRFGPDHLLPRSDGTLLLATLRAIPLASISKERRYYQISLPLKPRQ